MCPCRFTAIIRACGKNSEVRPYELQVLKVDTEITDGTDYEVQFKASPQSNNKFDKAGTYTMVFTKLVGDKQRPHEAIGAAKSNVDDFRFRSISPGPCGGNNPPQKTFIETHRALGYVDPDESIVVDSPILVSEEEYIANGEDAAFDWSTSPVLAPSHAAEIVQNQGHCSSCYAWASTTAYSYRLYKATRGKWNIWASPQSAMSCTAGTCTKGGNAYKVYMEMEKTGFPPQWCNAYDFNSPKATACSSAAQASTCRSPLYKVKPGSIMSIRAAEQEEAAPAAPGGLIQVAVLAPTLEKISISGAVATLNGETLDRTQDGGTEHQSIFKSPDGKTAVYQGGGLGDQIIIKAEGKQVTIFKSGDTRQVASYNPPRGGLKQYRTYADGTTIATKINGDEVQTNPDGTTIATKATGDKLVTRPNGMTIATNGATGDTVQTNPDGTTIAINGATGDIVQTNPDGTTIATKATGDKVQTDPDGSKHTTIKTTGEKIHEPAGENRKLRIMRTIEQAVRDIITEVKANGPVSISINPVTDEFQNLGGAVYNTPQVPTDPQKGHAVVLVGWGEDASGLKYWKIQNSWGKKWGVNGFGRIARGKNVMNIELQGITFSEPLPPNVCSAGVKGNPKGNKGRCEHHGTFLNDCTCKCLNGWGGDYCQTCDHKCTGNEDGIPSNGVDKNKCACGCKIGWYTFPYTTAVPNCGVRIVFGKRGDEAKPTSSVVSMAKKTADKAYVMTDHGGPADAGVNHPARENIMDGDMVVASKKGTTPWTSTQGWQTGRGLYKVYLVQPEPNSAGQNRIVGNKSTNFRGSEAFDAKTMESGEYDLYYYKFMGFNEISHTSRGWDVGQKMAQGLKVF